MSPGPDFRYLARKWAWTGLDLLYPPRCAGCGRPGARWCTECQATIHPLPIPLCSRCGGPVSEPEDCPRCARQPLSLVAVRSLAPFEGPLRNAIHRLKYYRDQPLAQTLGEALADYWQRLNWPAALVIGVPLSRERLAERGYNQADLLAEMLAGAARLPAVRDGLRRRRHTLSQVGLSEPERWENVHDAFEARVERAAGRRILLVDDVFTTGATLEACAQALLLAGATEVYGLTIARPVR